MNMSAEIARRMKSSSFLVLADTIGATQIISFVQPLAAKNACGEVRLRLQAGKQSKNVLRDSIKAGKLDAVFLSRFTLADGVTIAGMARNKNIPVIFHLDDDLLNVPLSIGADKYAVHNDPERLAALRANISAADLLYASTPALAQTFEGYDLNVPIVSGDIYCSINPADLRESAPSTMPTIGYMGTGGHSADLALIMPAIEALMDEFSFLRFETFGTIQPPPEMARFGHRYAHHDKVDNYSAFVRKLQSLGWWVGLAPLDDNPFNACKADTKWVEYSLAGAVTVASDLPVYHRACAAGAGILASSADAWMNALRNLVLNDRLRNDLLVGAQNKLQSIYTHDVLERQIFSIVQMARNLRQGQRDVVTGLA